METNGDNNPGDNIASGGDNAAPAGDNTNTPAVVVDDNGDAVSTGSYVDGKFTSVGDLEKSYKELESSYSKKLGGFDGAPEAYTFNEENELNASEKGLRDMLSGWGSENQLSQAGFEGLVEKYNEFQTSQRDDGIAEARKALGANAEARLKNVRDFMKANLGEDMTKALAANMNTASSIEAIEKLISMTKTAPAANNNTASEGFITKARLDELRFAVDENGQRKMSTDPQYRKMVLEAEQQARG